MTGLVVLMSALFVAGVSLMVLPPGSAPSPTFNTASVRRFGMRFVGAAAVGVLVFVVSSWLVPGIVVGVGVHWAIGGWQRRQRSTATEIMRLDALASWIENVRDVLMAGEQPIGAILLDGLGVSAGDPAASPSTCRWTRPAGSRARVPAVRR